VTGTIRPRARLRGALLVVSIAAGCGGGSSATPAAPAAPSPPALATVVVSLKTSTIQVGQGATATARGLDQNGASFAIGTPSWSITPAGTATVRPDGSITAVAAGAASVIALVGGKQGQAAFTVVPVAGPDTPVADLVVSPFNRVVANGDSLQLLAIPRDAFGNTLSGRKVTWTSSAPELAAVSADGLVTTKALGTVIIVATVEGQHAGASITIIGAVDPDIVVAIASPVKGDIVGDTLKVYATVSSSFPLALVVASVGTVQAELSPTPAGALGLGVAWVGALDLSLLRFGPYAVTVIGTDSRGHRGIGSQTFERDTRKGGASGNPASGSKQALPRVPSRVP
jgi:hypothetical protein